MGKVARACNVITITFCFFLNYLYASQIHSDDDKECLNLTDKATINYLAIQYCAFVYVLTICYWRYSFLRSLAQSFDSSAEIHFILYACKHNACVSKKIQGKSIKKIGQGILRRTNYYYY